MTTAVPSVDEGFNPELISGTSPADWKNPAAPSRIEHRWRFPDLAEWVPLRGTLYNTEGQFGPVADDGSPVLREVLAPTRRAAEAPAAHEQTARVGVKGWPTLPGYEILEEISRLLLNIGVNQAAVVLQRDRVEEALRASERRFRGTFENAAVGIAHTHPTGQLLRVNEKFCTIVGYPREELLQKTYQDITHPDDLASSAATLEALVRGESPALGHEKRYLRKDGSPVWAEIFVSLQRDAPGRGSAFVFTAHFGLQPHPPEPAAVRPLVLLHDLPVLVVDDNATNRRLLEEWLRGWGIKPLAVGNGLAALDALWHGAACGRAYPLVLLDARMPDVDGLVLATQIRQRAELSATRIILLTSGDRPSDLARARELRIDAHLLKPVQPDELLETIYRVMDRAGGDAPLAAAHPAGVGTRPGAGAGRGAVARLGGGGQRVQRAAAGAAAGAPRPPGSAGERRPAGAGPGRRGRLRLAAAGRPHAGVGRLPGRPGSPGARAGGGGHLPIIALTARARKEDRERCLTAGMDDFLAKPIRADDLWEAMERVVGPARWLAERDWACSTRGRC